MNVAPRTPVKDILGTFNLVTKEGIDLNKNLTPGQLEIAECILYRQAPDGQKRVHIMAHTRYGKSMIVGACVAIRAATKKERWVIVAPTKEQAQIIMDYVIHFSVNDPIISQLLKVNAKQIKEEQLTQRRSRDHITYLKGGEVRTFSSGATMGHGAPNLIMDEAGLIDDSDEAKAYRMLGDHVDNFLIKIGNPWFNNHFKKAFLDESYYHINIPVEQGIKEGRVTEEYHASVIDKPHYDVLYKNQFPDDEAKDAHGYLPLFTHAQIEGAQVAPGTLEHLGKKILGGDGADGGANMSAAVTRSNTLAQVSYVGYKLRSGDFGDTLATFRDNVEKIATDALPPGNECNAKLRAAQETKRKLVEVNAGAKVPDKLPNGEDPKDYLNMRAYIFWQMRKWILAGGKLERSEHWKMLLSVKYKITNGKLQIVSKEELRRLYQVHDLGIADALSFTFTPEEPQAIVNMPTDVGGVKPFYPELNF